MCSLAAEVVDRKKLYENDDVFLSLIHSEPLGLYLQQEHTIVVSWNLTSLCSSWIYPKTPFLSFPLAPLLKKMDKSLCYLLSIQIFDLLCSLSSNALSISSRSIYFNLEFLLVY